MAFKTPEKDKMSGLYMVKNFFYHDQADRIIISPRRYDSSIAVQLYLCWGGGGGGGEVHCTIFLNSQCDRCRHQVYVKYAGEIISICMP